MRPLSTSLRTGQTFVAAVSRIIAAATMTPRNFEGSNGPRFRSIALRPMRGAVAFLAVIILAPAVAFAIGPNTQTVPDATVNAMAPSLYATGFLTGPLGQIGTGTVIGETPVNQNSTVGYVAILTANHVASSGVNTFTLGFNATGAATPFTLTASVGAFQTYTIPAPQNTTGPPLLPEDISVMLAAVNLTKGANRGNYNTLLANTPTITNPTNNPLIPHPLANATFTPPKLFSEIGYGIQAMYNPNIGGGGVMGYQYTDMSGQRLFQNNGATAYTLAANSNTILAGSYAGYFEPFDRFQVLAPNTANTLGPGGANVPNYGGAATFGDSGSPLYTGGSSITFASGSGNDTMAFTNSISAILVAGFPVMTVVGTALINGSNEYAVPIDTPAVYNWIENYAMNPLSIPEPSSAVLLGIGFLGFLAWRCSDRIRSTLVNMIARLGNRKVLG